MSFYEITIRRRSVDPERLKDKENRQASEQALMVRDQTQSKEPGTHQRPMTIPLDLVHPVNIHLAHPIHEVSEHIHKRLLDELFAAQDRTRVPPERRQVLLRLLQPPPHLLLLCGPRGDRGRDRRRELEGRVQRVIHPAGFGGGKVVPRECLAFRVPGLEQHVSISGYERKERRRGRKK
jgi:hypothetical protein